MISRLTYKNQYHFYTPKINQKLSWKKDNILSVNKTKFFLGINLTEDIFNKLTGEKLQNIIFFFKFLFIIYFLPCLGLRFCARAFSLVAASGGHSSSQCAGLSPSRPLLLRSTGSRRAGSVVVAHGPSCSVACGIFPDQGSNPCPLHWQADSQPLRHQGSPQNIIKEIKDNPNRGIDITENF